MFSALLCIVFFSVFVSFSYFSHFRILSNRKSPDKESSRVYKPLAIRYIYLYIHTIENIINNVLRKAANKGATAKCSLWRVCLFACLSVCSVCLCVCSVCLFVCPSVCSVWNFYCDSRSRNVHKKAKSGKSLFWSNGFRLRNWPRNHTQKINKKSRTTTTRTGRRWKLNPRQATAMAKIATTSQLKVSSSNNKVIRKRNEVKTERINTKWEYSRGIY